MTASLYKDEEARACLEQVLASALFAQAERQKRLLSYLVTETLAGRAEKLKGYTIGVEVFDREADFDPAIDAIVRVQAGQLRSKLREYYDSDGAGDPIRFELPKGNYALRIVSCSSSTNVFAPKDVVPAVPLTPIRDKPSLVVLPFVNMSSDPEQEYFADGITEDLTTELSQLSGLFVISRHSAFAYKKVSKRAEEIGAELGVRYLIEGSVRKADERVRISAQLIDTASADHVWAERYDRELNDIFAVQDDVTRRIVEVLRVKLSSGEAERIGHEGTEKVAALDMLLRGRERFLVCTPEANAEAKSFFTKALEIDPNYAAAHARFAAVYVRDWAFDWADNREVLEKAFQLALRAAELDERLPLAHAILGWVQLWRGQAKEAIAAGRRAVKLDGNNADARLFLSFSLASFAHGDEALTHIQIALRLNPYPSATYLSALGICHYALNDYEHAIAAQERGVKLNPQFLPCLRSLVALYHAVGRIDDSRKTRQRILQLVKSGRGTFANRFFLDKALSERYERERKSAWKEDDPLE